MSVLQIFAILGIIVAGLAVLLNIALGPPPVPEIPETWWGPGDPSKQDKSIRSVKVNISDNYLADLKYRLDHHRPFVPPLEGIQQQYGMNTNFLKTIVDYWRKKYNWREREKRFNKFEQFKTNIQGLDIHFVRQKPTTTEGVKVVPLLIVHGWPGSVTEFFEILPLLTTPRNGIVFDVIAPHIPGFGFSDPAVRPGMGAAEIALIMKNLMNRLGFEKFYVQGGDFGAIILQQLSVLFPESVLGLHSNMCTIYTPKSYLYSIIFSLYPKAIVKEEHIHKMYPLKESFNKLLRESGYFHLQATKPDTIGVGMSDSPVALAAYVLEKFVTGHNFTYQVTDPSTWLNDWFSFDELLDNIMVYWWTNSMTTAFRIYSETFSERSIKMGVMRIPLTVPSACARFENDFYAADGLLPEIHPYLLQLTDHHGGHFAALQLPKVLADDIFSAVYKFEEFNKKRENKH